MSAKLLLFPIAFPYNLAPIASSIATGLVVIGCCMSKAYKDPLGAMVMMINATDFLYVISKATFSAKSDITCQIFNYFCLFGLISSVIWSALFGHACYALIRNPKTEVIWRFMKYYLVLAVMVPIILCIVSIFIRFAMYEDHQCVHYVYPGSVDIKFMVLVDIPVLICCFLSVFWYYLIYKEIKKELGSARSLRIFLAYPMIMVICWTPIVASDLYGALGGYITSEWLQIFAMIDHFQGLLDAIVYGGEAKRAFYNAFSKMCSKKGSQQGSMDYYDATVAGEIQQSLRKSDRAYTSELSGPNKSNRLYSSP